MFSSVAANLTNTNRMAVEVRSKQIFFILASGALNY